MTSKLKRQLLRLHQIAGTIWFGSTVSFFAGQASNATPEFASLCADRAAIERVYYNHRLGNKPPFAQASPVALVERLVKDDSLKEAVLKKVYGAEITSAQIDAEVQRINTTTRAPNVLADLKVALGNDPARFARTVAKPLVVERTLRDCFSDDDRLHATQRREAETVRERLFTAKSLGKSVEQLIALMQQDNTNRVRQTTWQLGARSSEKTTDISDLTELQKRFGANAQIISTSHDPAEDPKSYFDDLPSALRTILRAQLRQPGDISAVVEMPDGFALYLTTAKTVEMMSVGTLWISKRGYKEWLNSQLSFGK